MTNIKIKPKSKVEINWKVNQYDRSDEKAKAIAVQFSKKYNVPLDRITVVQDIQTVDDNGNEFSLTKDVITNINDSKFQFNLFQEYAKINNIENVNWDMIKEINSYVDDGINYDVYNKYRRFTVKWVKWSNFLSYGEDNFFDFTKMKGMVFLTSEPKNQSGKTTFAIDLLHFLLFGKTEKYDSLGKIFNKFLENATEFSVEGCLNIDGQDFLIKRTVTRPKKEKRKANSKVSQKVEYYQIIGDVYKELTDDADVEALNHSAENSVQTNKVIKEAIGNESDFDMIICATGSNIDKLIEMKETERGKVLSKWIGLLPIEEKDIIARDIYNSSIKTKFLSNRYNEEILKTEIDDLGVQIKEKEQNVNNLTKNNFDISNEIKKLEDEQSKLTLLNIDENLAKYNRETVVNEQSKVKDEGIIEKGKLERFQNEYQQRKDVVFSDAEYDKVNETYNNLSIKKNQLEFQRKTIVENQQQLKNAEYCPTCHRKLDNVDNTAQINQMGKQINEIDIQLVEIYNSLKQTEENLNSLKTARQQYNEKVNLELKIAALNTKLAQLREKYQSLGSLIKEIDRAAESIEYNNQIKIKINNINAKLYTLRNSEKTNLISIEQNNSAITTFQQQILEKKGIIVELKKEAEVNRTWKLYLEMIGKNGISKMVLRKALPLINLQLKNYLTDVCDFDVEIIMNDKNDVYFYLIKDGVYSSLSGGSGFEKTISALALRFVLGNISSLPKMQFLVVDEIFGRVARDNYEKVKLLFEKATTDYEAVIIVSHLLEIKEWCNHIITVVKENNISRLVEEIK